MKRALMMILPLPLCPALPAQAAEAPKDYMFRGLLNLDGYKLVENR